MEAARGRRLTRRYLCAGTSEYTQPSTTLLEISLVNEKLLMTPINITSECVPKDIKGSGAYTEPGQPAPLWQAGSYGSALSTLRTKLVAAMEGQFTTKAAPRLVSVVQYQVGTHPNRMAPNDWIGGRLLLKLSCICTPGMPNIERFRTQVLPRAQHAFSWRVWHSV